MFFSFFDKKNIYYISNIFNIIYILKSSALRRSIPSSRPIFELYYVDLMINSFDHRKNSPIIHGYSKRLVEFIADNQDGRGWMRKKKREKSEGEGWIQITLEEWKERD